MRIGASTSNLYPLPTEQALDRLLALGFRDIEVFFNTESELTPAFVDDLRRRGDAAGARFVAVHPYTSGYEPYMLFSNYSRRTADGFDHYRRLYEAAARLGAAFVSLHGDRPTSILTPVQAAQRTMELAAWGQPYGVRLLQENVFNFRSSQTEYLRLLRQQWGEQAGFTLDLKQCRRCGLAAQEVLEAMGGAVAHVHVSDADAEHDCLVPGQGTADFAALARRLRADGFDGVWMLELYRCNFEDPAALWAGKTYLEQVLSL